MSDLAAGIPIGMSIGIGAGIAIGKKSAQKEMAKKIQELNATHDIKVKKASGQYMAIEEFIEAIGAVKETSEDKNKMLIIVAIGILVLLGGILAFFMVQ